MAVTGVEITRREAYENGQTFGETGAYERIDGVLTISVDPDNEANRPIVDLELAPRDADGRVRFQSDFTILAPQEPSRGNQRLIVDVVNRGRRRVVSTFNRADPTPDGSNEIDPGDGFLFHHGYSIVSIGWQWDVFRSESLLGLVAPRAEIDGQPVTGQAVVEIRPNVVEHTRLLANRVHQPYPVVDGGDPEALLTVRDWEDGPDTVISRSQWRFARESGGDVVPSREHVYVESGFQPGKIYHVIFKTDHAPVVGTGLLAVRDVAVWLRHSSSLNPVRGGYERAYGYGVSQTGRMLRHLVYLGLNLDEEGRVVFDGLLPHVAGGRRGEFNHRNAQPSQQSAPGFGQMFPFADDNLTDPITERADGLLDRLRELNAVPRIVYTNSSAEYWRGDGSLAHMDPLGRTDLEGVEESRSYHFAGTQHGAGTLPLPAVEGKSPGSGPDGSSARYPFNVVDYRPLLRAALVNLDRWVSQGVEPPPSRYPRIDDGTAVTRADLFDSLDCVPGLVKPDPDRLWVIREVDLGPDAERGTGRYPVREGHAYPCYVSAVDGDGNELAGVRLPDLTVPVGTHAGWNPRAPETGAPEQIVSMQGFSNFFAPTESTRQAADDSRPSIEERYESREAYLQQVRDAAQELAADRYLLDEDIEIVVAACADRYDTVMESAVASGAMVGDDS